MYQQILLDTAASIAPSPPSWVSFLNSALLLLIAAVLGFGGWWLQQKMSGLSKSATDQEQCLDEKSLLDMETQGVLLQLGIVTGKAVKEGTCNGEMTEALNDALDVQTKRSTFLERMATQQLKRKHN